MATLLGRGRAVQVVRSLAELVQTVSATAPPAVVVVDLLSTVGSQHDLDGYKEFLRVYSDLGDRTPLSLVVITPSPKAEMGLFFGCGDLVTTYLNDPIETGPLKGIIDRIALGI